MNRNKIISRMRQYPSGRLLPDARSILYGSQARGDARADSDFYVFCFSPPPAAPIFFTQHQNFRPTLFHNNKKQKCPTLPYSFSYLKVL